MQYTSPLSNCFIKYNVSHDSNNYIDSRQHSHPLNFKMLTNPDNWCVGSMLFYKQTEDTPQNGEIICSALLSYLVQCTS